MDEPRLVVAALGHEACDEARAPAGCGEAVGRVVHLVLTAEAPGGEGVPASVLGQGDACEVVGMAVDKSPAERSVVQSLDDGGVCAVGLAVDHRDRAETIDALVGVVGEDDLGPAFACVGVDVVLDAGAIVADDGLPVALHGV